MLFLVRRVGPYHDARFEAAGRKLDLTVVETRPGSAEYPWTTAAGARQYRLLAFRAAKIPEAGLRGPILAAEIGRILEDVRPDVVATAGWADPEYHALLRHEAARALPAIVMSDSTWEDEPRHWWKERLKASLLRHYSAAVVAGSRSRDYLWGLGLPAAAMFQPLDVVDNRHFAAAVEQRRASFRPRRFLCVARFIPKKNLSGLLDAYAAYVAEAGFSAWALTLCGAGPLEADLRAQVAAAGLDAWVEFAGFRQYPELPECYACAGALVLPSTSDQWGLVVNEAMAAGLPVLVAQQCGCAPDLVQEGVNGFGFDAHDRAALQNCLRRVSDLKPAQWEAMSRAAQETIAAFSPESFGRALAEATARVLASGGQRTPHFARLVMHLAAARQEAAP